MLGKSLVGLAFVLLLAPAAGSAQSANPADDLVSTWTLVQLNRGAGSDEETRQPSPRGVLILDAAGNVFEFFSTNARTEPESPQADPQRAFRNFGGFWGRYELGDSPGEIRFSAETGVSPSVRGRQFSRRFELDGEWLVMTSTDEPQAQRDVRWTWQRVPTVEHLTPTYREVVGFWQHVEERRVDTGSGEVLSTNRRAPSVIVYTPGGFVGVHFPSLGREAFDGPDPSAEEALAGLRGYIGYFGTLGVYPGEVSHNLLSGISPATGAILRRYAEIDGDELLVTLQSQSPRPDDAPPPVVTEVLLRRLSGADEMLPPPER